MLSGLQVSGCILYHVHFSIGCVLLVCQASTHYLPLQFSTSRSASPESLQLALSAATAGSAMSMQLPNAQASTSDTPATEMQHINVGTIRGALAAAQASPQNATDSTAADAHATSTSTSASLQAPHSVLGLRPRAVMGPPPPRVPQSKTEPKEEHQVAMEVDTLNDTPSITPVSQVHANNITLPCARQCKPQCRALC